MGRGERDKLLQREEMTKMRLVTRIQASLQVAGLHPWIKILKDRTKLVECPEIYTWNVQE